MRMMKRTVRPTALSMGTWKTSRSRLLSRTPMPRPSSRLRAAVRDMMPSPPSWMSTRITAWPKTVNPVPGVPDDQTGDADRAGGGEQGVQRSQGLVRRAWPGAAAAGPPPG